MQNLRRFISHRTRLTLALGIGVTVAIILPTTLSVMTRSLIAWNAGVWLYLCFMVLLMIRADHAQIRKIAEQEDETAVAVLAIMSIAAIASLVAIVFELASLKQLSLSLRLSHYAFTGATVIGSWCLLGILYTFHYAHLFFTAAPNRLPLAFPEGELNPNYWDFLYFSFTIAVAMQTSDIMVMNRSMRKTVLAQSVLSFVFNVAILGLSINIAAGLVGS